MIRPARSGFALIDLAATAFVCAVLTAIVVYQVQEARLRARAVGCRNNLRQIGMALVSYTETHGVFPVVRLVGPGMQLAHSPLALLLPFLPQPAGIPYDPKQPWFNQEKGIGSRTVPVFRCPASAHRDPADVIPARGAATSIGNMLGTTDYIVCKGPNDSWCLESGVSAVPLKERGPFEIGRPLRFDDISDGTSQTFAIGEGTMGADWLISLRGPLLFPAVDQESGRQIPAQNFWIWPFLNTVADQQHTHVVAASVFGSTAVVLNRYPVIETIANTEKLGDCRPSYREGFHAVSGFRSDHPRGAFFLLADGSVRHFPIQVEPRIYYSLSTVAGGEVTQFITADGGP